MADRVAIDCVPKPVNPTFRVGFTGSELLMTSSVVRVPVAVGVKVRLIVQVNPAASPPPPIGHGEPEADIAKSPAFPVTRLMLLMINAALPVLDRVKF